MKDKILICGKGPNLKTQLKGKKLTGFFVVRVNEWKPIRGYDNKCDAWAFYPHNHIGEPLSLYDITPYLKKTKEIWMPHYGFAGECKRITGKNADYIISKQETKFFHQIIGHPNPTSGAVVVYMATLLDADVYIAGFDFYTGNKKYYGSDEPQNKTDIEHHKPWMEKKWFSDQIKTGRIISMPEIKEKKK